MNDGMGTVYLVGAGPGDPRLLTLRAREVIAAAEVVVYDRLVHPAVLAHAPVSAEKIYVGKQGGGKSAQQTAIHDILIDRAKAGYTVVRIKGGDPLVFGRGGEEALVLSEHKIRFEWVPGISSALAAPAYGGIPATHRGVSRRFTVVSGHDISVEMGQDGQIQGTWVILMGANHLRRLTDHLVRQGLDRNTPAQVIQWGTWGVQKVARGTINSVAECAQERGVRAPAVLVVGQTVSLAEKLNWWQGRPLNGLKIAVVHTGEEAVGRWESLRNEGAEVIMACVGRWMVEESTASGPDLLGTGRHLIYRRLGAEAFWEALQRSRLDLRQLSLRLVAMDDEAQSVLSQKGFWDVERMSDETRNIAAGEEFAAPSYAWAPRPEDLRQLRLRAWEPIAYAPARLNPQPLDALTSHWLFSEPSHFVVFTSPEAVHQLIVGKAVDQWDLLNAAEVVVPNMETVQVLQGIGRQARAIARTEQLAYVREEWIGQHKHGAAEGTTNQNGKRRDDQ